MDVDEAFRSLDRADFLPEAQSGLADIDAPVPIGHGQTNSQPYTVRLMLQWLDVRPGQKVLDVGSGSGWTTALLSRLVGDKGKIYAVELVPELVEFGRRNLRKAGIKNAKLYQAGQIYGLPQPAPYDRILVSAAARQIPQELVDQLIVDGKMVVPINNDILEVTKNKKGLDIITHPGFAFVPLLNG